MKFTLILLVASVACILAAPVAEQQEQQDAESSSVKAKRGLHLGLGYHAPLITHSHYVAAPATVVHHAPIISHAPLIAHAPSYRIILHFPTTCPPTTQFIISEQMQTYRQLDQLKAERSQQVHMQKRQGTFPLPPRLVYYQKLFPGFFQL